MLEEALDTHICVDNIYELNSIGRGVTEAAGEHYADILYSDEDEEF